MRAAIYARYSSENQNERSIEDQTRLCRELIERRGWSLGEIFADFAISGASLKNRPQANRLLEAARAGEFEIVVAEALGRTKRGSKTSVNLGWFQPEFPDSFVASFRCATKTGHFFIYRRMSQKCHEPTSKRAARGSF